MEKSLKNTYQSPSKSTQHDTIQRITSKDKSIFLPSFQGITSNQTFQESSQSNRITQKSDNHLNRTQRNIEELIMINDGLEYIFDFTTAGIDNDDIFDTFQDLSKQLQFQMIQRQQNYSTCIKQNKNNSLLSKVKIIQWLTGCFPSFNKQRQNIKINSAIGSTSITAIKVVISGIVQGQNATKICRIRGLSGSLKQAKNFIQRFKQKMLHYLPSSCTSDSNYFFYDLQKQGNNQTKKSIQHSDPYHLQISTVYFIQKIISDQKYQISSITHQLIDDYRNSFKNIQESILLIPQPVTNAIKIVNEIYYWFNKKMEDKKQNQTPVQNNKKSVSQKLKITKNQAQKQNQIIKQIQLNPVMLPFLRISIQKLVFKKLLFPIQDIYIQKNIELQSTFLNKRNKIFQKYSTKQILQEISLNQKFWGVRQNSFDCLQLIHSRQQTRKLLKMAPSCCSQIQKISLTISPRQKIKHLQLAYTSLKTFFYDFSKQKYASELSSMEDIIPVLILIMLLVNVQNLRKQLDLIGDFIESDPYEMQSEKRLYINVSESYNYVLRDWKV